MRKQLDKSYNPNIEPAIYARWQEKGYFHATVDKTKKPYTIMIPPPNITGQLHLGHAFTCSLQDALIRWKRMQGYSALWLPGTDHASISTEVRIVDQMHAEGLSKADVGREGFLERAWAWNDQYGGRIVEQLKLMGFSCDWERQRFTMDEGLNKAVTEVFNRLYEKGLIYRGERLCNWCVKCKTTISDAEVDHEEREDKLWYFKYPIDGTKDFLTFATTRPETMLGDTAIAVHPDDERYKRLVGKTVTVPIVNRPIPIIADEYVEPAFGAGVVKITPGHDPNDFEVGLRHNLPIINILNDDGAVNENGAAYAGLSKEAARARIIEEFQALGLYVKEEKITHAVGTHERCHEVVEPLVKLQWFVKMAPLAKPAADAYRNGELHLYPERFGKTYLNWLDNIRDWCVSRQLWWGHQIPAWYCDCGETIVARQTPERCPKCGGDHLTRDPDTLDTWFSSALWPFSTLGWPDKTPELDYFYPTDTLVTAYDILFFWVVRMVFSGIEQMGELPFKDVLFNGLIRDAQGKKMSKSAGNGVDPLDIVAHCGSDALRLTLLTGNSVGNDLRFHEEKLEAARNFLNKLWNAARFILMNMDGDEDGGQLQAADKWILSRVNKTAKECGQLMASYELGMAAQLAHDFVWDEFCDWYIEFVKPRLYDKENPTRPAALYTLRAALTRALKLLHPFLPFITEEIYQALNDTDDTIMLAEWPDYDPALDFPEDERRITLIQELVKAVRVARSEMGVAPARKPHLFVVTAQAEAYLDGAAYIKTLAGASEVTIQPGMDGIGDDAVCVVTSAARVYLPLADLIDTEKERERLNKERKRLEGEVARADGKLNNPGFLAKAPEAVLAEERAKADKYRDMLRNVVAQLDKLK